MWVRLKVIRLAMKMATRRPLPERIPLSGKERTEKRNYTAPFLTKEGERKFLVEKVIPEGFEGQWFETRTSAAEPRSIPNAEITSYGTRFEQYAAEMEITYDSPLEFIIYRLLGVPWLIVRRERLAQFIYNQRKPVKASRMRVLRHFLARTQEDHDYRAAAERLMTELHGVRWSRNEANVSLFFNYERLLDSLVESGDLVKNEHSYVLANEALLTLERYEDDRARQREGSQLQRMLIYVTLALAFVGLIQAYATLVAADKPLSALIRPFHIESPVSPPTSAGPNGETPRSSGNRAE